MDTFISGILLNFVKCIFMNFNQSVQIVILLLGLYYFYFTI